MTLSPKQSLYEHELKGVVNRFGNMAQVWSALEISPPDKISEIIGLSSIQLHFQDGRWFIYGWTCGMALKENPIVEKFLNLEEDQELIKPVGFCRDDMVTYLL